MLSMLLNALVVCSVLLLSTITLSEYTIYNILESIHSIVDGDLGSFWLLCIVLLLISLVHVHNHS